jgi:GPH family glycoside/pentoside/hexuronide:cation symporter
VLAAALLLALGFRGAVLPAGDRARACCVWCAALLALTYLSYSVLSVLHQAWGARLGGGEDQRAASWPGARVWPWWACWWPACCPRWPACRRPARCSRWRWSWAWPACWRAPRPPTPRRYGPAGALPLRTPAFRRLLAVYLVNGIASAVPATLVLFFIRDRLQAPAFEPLFLASYFAAGALSMPLWVRARGALRPGAQLAGGMVLAVVHLRLGRALGAGDVAAFTVVCVASGVALGADLALPGALLAGVMQRAGHGGQLEGAYFGWWNFATKLNLALAAGWRCRCCSCWATRPVRAATPQALQALTAGLLPAALPAEAAGRRAAVAPVAGSRRPRSEPRDEPTPADRPGCRPRCWRDALHPRRPTTPPRSRCST